MNRFIQATRDLQIKKVAENIRVENPNNAKYDLTTDIHKDDKYCTENENAGKSLSDNDDEINNFDEIGSGRQLHQCNECEASYVSKSGLYNHTSSKHKGVYFSCKHCGYKATFKGDLKKHQESIHEGVKYSCVQCDFLFTNQSNLRQHIKSLHEGAKYPCYKCDYYANNQSNLRQHKRSVHESVKYSCNQCNYQAVRLRSLKKHETSVHAGKEYCKQYGQQKIGKV